MLHKKGIEALNTNLVEYLVTKIRWNGPINLAVFAFENNDLEFEINYTISLTRPSISQTIYQGLAKPFNNLPRLFKIWPIFHQLSQTFLEIIS